MPNPQASEVVDHSEALPQGVPGRNLLRFAGTIPAADLNAMSAAIEQGCEQVEINEWKTNRKRRGR